MFRGIRNERMTRVIYGIPFSSDITSYIDPESEYGYCDFITGEKLKYEDCDGLGVICFSDLPDGKNICKIESLIKEGYIGLLLDDDQHLSFSISSSQLLISKSFVADKIKTKL